MPQWKRSITAEGRKMNITQVANNKHNMMAYLSCLLWLLVLIQTQYIVHLGLEEDFCQKK